MFIIEPCQTMWGYDGDAAMSCAMRCAMRIPKDSVLLAFEANNLLIRHPILTSESIDDYESMHLKAIELGVAVSDTELGVAVSDTELGKDAVFIGVIRIGEGLKSYAVFAREPHTTVVYNITQIFQGLDTARIAKIFAEDVQKSVESKLNEI